MGLVTSKGLTQYDVEEVIRYCGDVYSQQEVLHLYRRFRSLDRNNKGFLSEDEIMKIPELSINPLSSRIVRLFENVNFKEFCRNLSAFSSKASRDEKIKFLFRIYDIDGDDRLSEKDMELMLKQLTGSQLTNEQIEDCVNMAFRDLQPKQGIDYQTFKKIFGLMDLSKMQSQIPIED